MKIRELSPYAREKLIEAGFDENKYRWTSTPLILAAFHGDLDVVRELVENKASLELEDTRYHCTALMWAAESGHHEVVSYLLAQGADVSHTSYSGGERQNAYLLSKKKSCCSAAGFWQRVEQWAGISDIDKTHQVVLESMKKRR